MALSQVTAAMREKAWAQDTWVEAQKELFFAPFVGEEEPLSDKAEATSFNSIFVKKTDLTKKKGDTLEIRLLYQLDGPGVTGDNTLEGNEEALQYYYQDVVVNQLRNAVRIKGKMEEQRTSLKMRSDAKAGLKMWWANTLDNAMLAPLLASPTAGTAANATLSATIDPYYFYATDNRVLYGGAATSTATLSATDILTPLLLKKAKTLARIALPRIRPIMHKGKEWYVVLMHDFNKTDIARDADFQGALQNAWWRGDDNPIFSGADFCLDGMICWSYDKIPLYVNASGVAYSQCLFLGAQAGILAVANAGGESKRGEMDWNEEKFDFQNQVAFEAGMIFTCAKSNFNSIDLSAISIYTAFTVT